MRNWKDEPQIASREKKGAWPTEKQAKKKTEAGVGLTEASPSFARKCSSEYHTNKTLSKKEHSLNYPTLKNFFKY